MNSLYEQLKSYKAYDQDEQASCKAFMKFIETFEDDIYTRDNILGHVCGNAWVVNPQRTKALLAYHNVYKGYHWMGGHSDGETDILKVAAKELEEESGLTNFRNLNQGHFIDVNTEYAVRQIKNGKAVNAHLHFTLVYLFEASETEKLIINERENSGLKWFANEDIVPMASPHMKSIYERVIKKVKALPKL